MSEIVEFSEYVICQERYERARERYNYAGADLELASIRKRLVEIGNQVEPLAGLMKKEMSERKRLYASAFYVVVGRFPEEKK